MPDPSAAVDDLLRGVLADGGGAAASWATGGQRRPLRTASWPAGDERAFAVLSVTKPLTATLALAAAHHLALDLDEPLARELPGARPDVTLRHVLTHTSGTPEVLVDDVVRAWPRPLHTLEAALAAPPVVPPGTAYSYSTLAWCLLAALVERAHGAPLADVLRERWTAPAGATATTLGPPRQVWPVRGPADGLADVEVTRRLVAAAPPGAGLVSTAPDLVRLGRLLLADWDGAGHLLTPDQLAEAAADQSGALVDVVSGTVESHVGLGWGRRWLDGREVLPGGDRVLCHAGAGGSLLWVDPDADLVLALCLSAADGPRVWPDVVRAVYDGPARNA
ncbi:serine hydrolase domain-containing protein [Angustibacter peucedani]